MDTTFCPQCDGPAEVEWRAVLESTDGPVEHCRVRCLEGHWFLLPTASLSSGGNRRRTATDLPATSV